MRGAYFALAADLDGDGDLDVVSAHQHTGGIAWHRNDQLDAEWPTFIIDPGAAGARSVFIRNLDRDGDRDIVSASVDTDTVAWYENDGVGNFTRRVISDRVDGAYGVHVQDMNGDGRPDVLSAGHDDGMLRVHLQRRR